MRSRIYQYTLYATGCCLLVCNVARAGGGDLSVHSGTGFFVTPQYIVTNEHVLHDGCRRIIIQDHGKDWANAKIIATDAKHDLALIQTPMWTRDSAMLRSDFDEMKVGERLVAVGYPLETLTQGRDYEVVTAKLLNPKESLGKQWMLQFTHVIKLGYSGGPLLDEDGKVVGVVKDFAKMYETYTVGGKTSDKIYLGEVDEAINMTTLEEFLVSNNVTFRSGIKNDPRPGGLDFTINVQCVDKVQASEL